MSNLTLHPYTSESLSPMFVLDGTAELRKRVFDASACSPRQAERRSMQPACGLFVVAVESKTLDRTPVSSLIRHVQDLFATLGSSANAMEDTDGRDEASDVRICPPFDSQHMPHTNLVSAGTSH
jgi:hypothetical protein